MFVEHIEEIGRGVHRFGCTQKEIALVVERIVERGKKPFLRLAIEIDEHIATDNQIETRKRRVAQQIVYGKKNVLANFRFHLVAIFSFSEKAFEAGGRHLFGNGGRIDAAAGKGNCLFIQIGGKDLEARWFAYLRRIFGKLHGHRVRFLPGGAARHPHAHSIRARLFDEKMRNAITLQHVVGIRVAKEAGHRYQRIMKKGFGFGRRRVQQFYILIQI